MSIPHDSTLSGHLGTKKTAARGPMMVLKELLIKKYTNKKALPSVSWIWKKVYEYVRNGKERASKVNWKIHEKLWKRNGHSRLMILYWFIDFTSNRWQYCNQYNRKGHSKIWIETDFLIIALTWMVKLDCFMQTFWKSTLHETTLTVLNESDRILLRCKGK